MEYIKFSNFIDSSQYGYTAEETSNIDGDAKYLRITDIVPYYVDKERVPFCRITSKKKEQYLVKENDLLVARTGATTGYNIVLDNSFVNYVFASYLIRINYDKNKLYPKYVKHVLKSQQWYGFVNNYIGGSAQPGMNARVFGKFEFPYFDYKTQSIIARVLEQYDSFIENNNKRIKLLEQAAKEIYKEWFVRFRFPGFESINFKSSNLGKIPDIFEIVKMNEVITDTIGGGWGEEDLSEDFPQDAYVIRGADFPSVSKGDMSTCPYRYHKQSNYDARQLKKNDVVIEISGGTQEQPVGRTILITQEMLNKLDDKVICASFCKRLTLNQNVISPYYFYYWMQFLYDTRIIDRFQLQSTGLINFKFEYFLKKGDCLLPPKQLMKAFDNGIEPIRKRIDLLASENANLIKQRDLLLPRLMSGKLEV